MGKIYSYKTENGIKFALYPIPGVRNVSVSAVIAGGAANEDKKDVGTLHFLEHVVLDGTKKYPAAGDISQFSEEYAIDYGGHTNTLRTLFDFEAADTELEKVFDLASEIIINPLLLKESVTRNKGVIVTERRNRFDIPENVFVDEFYKLVQGADYLYNRHAIGEESTIKSITINDLEKTYNNFYGPRNLYIGVAGNVDVVRAKYTIQKYFGKWSKKQKKTRLAKPDPVVYSPRIFKYYQKRNQVKVIVYFPTQGFKDYTIKERFAITILNNVFGAAGSSILYRRLRNDLGLVYSVRSNRWFDPYNGGVTIKMTVSKDVLEKALLELLNIIRLVAKDGLPTENIERNRRYIQRAQLLRFSSVTGISDNIAHDLMTKEELYDPDQVVELVGSIKAKDVNKFSRFLDLGKVSVGLMGDKKAINDPKIEEELKKYGEFDFGS